MKIALAGASGSIGGCVLSEALARGHEVTGLTTDATRLTPASGLTISVAASDNIDMLADAMAGHDVVATAVRWNSYDIGDVLRAIRKSRVPRALFIVGAGSLLRTDGRTHAEHLADRGVFPPTSAPASRALACLRQVTHFEWTAVSPAGVIRQAPRTERYRLGGDQLLVDEHGVSFISIADFAIAVVDELVQPQHTGRRFTVAY